MIPHPAPFNPKFLQRASNWLEPLWCVLDPFAGIGRIHTLPNVFTVGLEIEPEWARQYPGTIIGDALRMPFRNAYFDAIVTSPAFGNRMSDHHDAKDSSKRITYKHTLGRDLHVNNSGRMRWGPRYRAFHEFAWLESDRVLRPGGRFLLNIKNFFIRGVEQPVTEWHVSTLLSLGYLLRGVERIDAPGMRFGANRSQRAEHEWLVAFDKPT